MTLPANIPTDVINAHAHQVRTVRAYQDTLTAIQETLRILELCRQCSWCAQGIPHTQLSSGFGWLTHLIPNPDAPGVITVPCVVGREWLAFVRREERRPDPPLRKKPVRSVTPALRGDVA